MTTEATAPTTLPEGVRLRSYAGEADVAPFVGISNAENAADGIPERWSVAEAVAEFRHRSESFDAARDVTIAEVEGVAIAFANREWVDSTDADIREYRLGGCVHPDWRGRGIGTALLGENERLLRALAATHDTPRARVFGSMSYEHQAADEALLRGAGYQPVRWFFDMVRPTLDGVPDVPLPPGLDVRRGTRDMFPLVWAAQVEAFQDHWGGFDASDAQLRRYMDNPLIDPTLWLIAFDGDEIAGGVVNTIYPEENEALAVQRGWLDSVFTRRPWRRRGLARALIARSLFALRERGMTSAVLGVDADNPSGALGLYESTGFAVEHRSTAWRKPMEGLR